MAAFILFAAGCALGALLVLALASPGAWPPEARRPRPSAVRRLARERESWLR